MYQHSELYTESRYGIRKRYDLPPRPRLLIAFHPHHAHYLMSSFKSYGVIGGGHGIRVARRRGVGRPCSKLAGGGVPERERGQR
jgi:hypothetical protein